MPFKNEERKRKITDKYSLIKQEEEEKEKRKIEVLEKEEVVVKTIHDNDPLVSEIREIPSYQHGKPFVFPNESLPKTLKISDLPEVNMKKIDNNENIQVRPMEKRTILKDHLENVKASLKS